MYRGNQLTYRRLKEMKVSKKVSGRKIGISQYWTKYNEIDDCMDINWHRRWEEEGSKWLLTAKVFPDGRVWFRPARSIQNKRLCIFEGNLLMYLTRFEMVSEKNQHGKGFWYYRYGAHTATIPTKDRKVSMGAVMFEWNSAMHEHYIYTIDPPMQRVVDTNKIDEITQTIKAVKSDVVLRAKLGAISREPRDKHAAYIEYGAWGGGAINLFSALKKAKQDDLSSYEPIVHEAVRRYGIEWEGGQRVDVPTHECVVKLLKNIRTSIIRHTGAVKYE